MAAAPAIASASLSRLRTEAVAPTLQVPLFDFRADWIHAFGTAVLAAIFLTITQPNFIMACEVESEAHLRFPKRRPDPVRILGLAVSCAVVSYMAPRALKLRRE
ncbi:MAG: hypothetical protein CMA10_04665 [Euryarchaeota archaeon]|nr:hypothetical protein [Euryarchaeota archaeon]